MKSKWSLVILGVLALCAAVPAPAQDSNSVIGPPQLRDFSLSGRREVAAPPPQAQPAPAQAPPAATPTQPRTQAPQRPPAERAASPRQAPVPTPSAPSPFRPQPAPQLPPIDQPVAEAPAPVPTPVAPAPSPAPTTGSGGMPAWSYAVPAAALLALLGLVLVRRRRKGHAEPVEERATVVAAPPRPVAPRPDPIPRPWLELALKAERASFTDTEAELQFELEISNKGGSAARNLRIDVKMFNGGIDQQDKDIGAFFRTAGRETTKLHLNEVAAGITGIIQGRVTLAREEMRAVKLDERLLFIPVVAVNALYDWGKDRTGQTSKSYVIGRELQEQGEKMGAFRVDQGPRIWRTVAQRPHTLAKRV